LPTRESLRDEVLKMGHLREKNRKEKYIYWLKRWTRSNADIFSRSMSEARASIPAPALISTIVQTAQSTNGKMNLEQIQPSHPTGIKPSKMQRIKRTPRQTA